MRWTGLKVDEYRWANFFYACRATLAAIVLLVAGCFSIPSVAQHAGEKTFSSPEDASSAIFTAAQNNDEKAMLDILGPEGK